MQIDVSHAVTYDLADAVPISDVIESLTGTERACKQIKPLLEGCVDGLTIESISVGVRSITQESPLRELFMFSLIVGFQDKLEAEVPPALESLIGHEIPDQYDTMVTVCVLIVLFYGADYLYRRFHSATSSKNIRRQLDSLISELAERTDTDEDKIRQILDEKYGRRSLKNMARAAAGFFAPSKHQKNASVTVGKRKIERDTVAEIPGDVAADALDPDDDSDYIENVEIEIHAQDLDRSKQGWAAVIPGHVDERIRMQIFPPVTPEQIFPRGKVRGDVVVVYQKEDGELRPTIIHLIRLRAEE